MKAYCNLTIRRLQMEALIAFAASAAPELYGQGTVSFSNLGVANSFVYDQRYGAPVKAAVGTTFSVALYWAPVDPLNPTVQPAPSVFTQQGPSGHIAPFAGDYAAGTVTILSISPPGGLAWFQVKAWDTACGTTFEQAAAMNNA